MERIICLVIGYVCGLFQTGYIIGKVHKTDIRDHGRHNWEYCDKKVKEFLEWIPLKNVFKMEEA